MLSELKTEIATGRPVDNRYTGKKYLFQMVNGNEFTAVLKRGTKFHIYVEKNGVEETLERKTVRKSIRLK